MNLAHCNVLNQFNWGLSDTNPKVIGLHCLLSHKIALKLYNTQEKNITCKNLTSVLLSNFSKYTHFLRLQRQNSTIFGSQILTLHFVVLSFDRYSRDDVMGEVTHAVNVDIDNMERRAPIPTLCHSCHNRWLCVFFKPINILAEKTKFLPIMAPFDQCWLFCCKITHFLCTFYRSNNVVVYQNWQISGMLFLKVMVEMEGLDFSNTEIAPLSLVREITPRQ